MKYAVGIFFSLIIMQLLMPTLILPPDKALAESYDAAQTEPAADAAVLEVEPATVPLLAPEKAPEPLHLSVNLLNSKTGEVTAMPLEQYLVGVVFAEMPASFGEEALKAQSVAARSYTFYKLFAMASGGSHTHGADVCDDYAHCQAYMSREDAAQKWGEEYITPLWDKVAACVAATEGVIMTYKGQPVNAVFHAMSVGMTESSVNVWGGEVEYLSAVSSPEREDSGIKDAVTTVNLTSEDFKETLQKNGYRGSFTSAPTEWLGERTLNSSGRVGMQTVCGIKLSGARLRQIFGLRSAMFDLAYDAEKDTFTFTVRGYGHGVGMSQQGANLMAQQGAGYAEILTHYYKGVDVVVDSQAVSPK